MNDQVGDQIDRVTDLFDRDRPALPLGRRAIGPQWRYRGPIWGRHRASPLRRECGKGPLMRRPVLRGPTAGSRRDGIRRTGPAIWRETYSPECGLSRG